MTLNTLLDKSYVCSSRFIVLTLAFEQAEVTIFKGKATDFVQVEALTKYRDYYVRCLIPTPQGLKIKLVEPADRVSALRVDGVLSYVNDLTCKLVVTVSGKDFARYIGKVGDLPVEVNDYIIDRIDWSNGALFLDVHPNN